MTSEPLGERQGEPPMNEDVNGAPKARGKRRMKQLGSTYESARAQVEADIIAQLGRPPSALDKVAAEALSSALIGSRRKRAAGRSDSESLKLVAQLARAFGLKPAPAGPPAPPNLQDFLDQVAADAAGQAEADEEEDS